MPNLSKRGGLREPKGGRPPNPLEKYISIHVKLPPYQVEWLKSHKLQTGQARNAFIVAAIDRQINLLETTDPKTAPTKLATEAQ